MQNNVTELTQKLRRSLDANYNVVDMVAVIDVITSLERIAITKEQLKDTRLGRYVNELRRKTSNQNLAKRAKELVKKWRNSVIPDSNGQVKQTTENNKKKRPLGGALGDNKADVAAAALLAKRSRLNGGITELDLSDNSNSSFKDVFANAEALRKDVIMINSDSNSSIADGKHDPLLEQQLPKKRGRKKGSKNHKNLLEEAESSFSNKMAVSRGNAKVKTTQELIASLQNRSSVGQNATNQNAASKLREDLNEKAAKLTERVSIIDQKLYSTNSNNFRNRKRSSLTNLKGERILESGVVTNIKPEEDSKDADEEIIVVDDDPKHQSQISAKEEPPEGALSGGSAPDFPKSLSLEEALRLLPPVDPSSLHEVGPDEGPACTCVLKENKPDFSVDAEEEEVDERPPERFEFVEDCRCPAAEHLDQRYRRTEVSEESVRRLLTTDIPGVNGNYGLGPQFDEMQKENRELKKLLKEGDTERAEIRERLDRLESIVESIEFKKIENNVIITGVETQSKSEKAREVVMKIVKKIVTDIREEDVVAAYRKTDKRENSPLVVQLARKELKVALLKARRDMGSITTIDCSLKGKNSHIYMNEQLTQHTNELFYQARAVRREKKYEHIWTRDGKIYISKDKTSERIRIKNKADLENL